ncbi:MAG: PTS lactose/cellobiose transporter subunit IIA [Bacillota bacterium]|nr:PTS lactose/cellobiose transporter subunit IIA [Bacillota bacterium]
MDEVKNIAFDIILYAGNGKSCSMEAIREAKKGNFQRSEELLKEASEELTKAHKYQIRLIRNDVRGETIPLDMLLIHSQDHLMTAMTVRDLAAEIIELYKTRN